MPGATGFEDLALLQDDLGVVQWAALATDAGAGEDRLGVLRLYRVFEGAVRTEFSVAGDDVFPRSPESHRGFRETGRWGFTHPILRPAEDGGPPIVVVVAADIDYAPSWILTLGSGGEVLGRVFHPGNLEGMYPLDDDALLVWGIANRLCAERGFPCAPHNQVVWVLPMIGDGVVASFPPACDALPEVEWTRGYLVDGRSWGFRGGRHMKAAAGAWVGLTVAPVPGGGITPDCGTEASFDRTGAFGNTLGRPGCPERPTFQEMPRDSAALCAELLERFPVPSEGDGG